MSRLSVITDELDADLDVALRIARDLGIEEAELRMIGGRNLMAMEAAEVTAAVETARAAGFPVNALATPVFKCTLPGAPPPASAALHGAAAGATLADHRRLLDDALDRAAGAGVPLVRMFSGWRVPDPTSVLDDVVEILEDAVRRGREVGVDVVLENEHDCNVATATETIAVLDRVEGLRVIWDPANHVRAGGAPEEAPLVGHTARIAHIHLKDVDDDGRWVPLGTGRVPYRAVVEEALAAGYDGAFSLETHCEIDGSRVAASAAAVERLRPLLDGRR